jgi:SAM-dependent methyltransferase
MTSISASQFLGKEGIIERNHTETMALIAGAYHGDIQAAKLALTYPEEGDTQQFYLASSRRVGGLPIYDITKSVNRKGLEIGLSMLSEATSQSPRILDVGCGNGLEACFVALSGTRVLGLDKSQAMLSYAQERARRLGLENVEFKIGDMDEPLHLDGQYDSSVSFFSLGDGIDVGWGPQAQVYFNYAIGNRIANIKNTLSSHGKIILACCVPSSSFQHHRATLRSHLQQAGLANVAVQDISFQNADGREKIFLFLTGINSNSS